MIYTDVVLDYTKIGQRVAQRRRELNISQCDFAERIDISNNYLSAIEHGKKHPSLEIWICICENLSISLDYLFSGRPNLDVNQNLIEMLKNCSPESQLLLSNIIDVFVKQDNLKKIK